MNRVHQPSPADIKQRKAASSWFCLGAICHLAVYFVQKNSVERSGPEIQPNLRTRLAEDKAGHLF